MNSIIKLNFVIGKNFTCKPCNKNQYCEIYASNCTSL